MRHKQALDIRTRVLGENHPDVAQSLHALAALAHQTNRWQEADNLYQQARDIYRKTTGENHPEFVQNLLLFASLYQATGNHAAAEPLLRQAVAKKRCQAKKGVRNRFTQPIRKV